MNRREYKEAAERLLECASRTLAENYTEAAYRRVEKFTNMARVYAMLAAIPDEPDTPATPGPNTGPGDVFDRIGR